MTYTERAKPFISIVFALALSGCLESESNTGNGFADPGSTGGTGSPSTNSAPLISGVPSTEISIGEVYAFTPTATDADGDTLTFSIENKPQWADFDSDTGELSGQPTLGAEGNYNQIRITVSDGEASASLPRFSIFVAEDQAPAGNSEPVISGFPEAAATADYMYGFVPTASDPDGDDLTFSVQNLPGWASFDESNGELFGMPRMEDVGAYSNILISASDGKSTTSLRPFTINVNEMGTLSTTLSWTAPTENEDGTALTDLAGYKLYWGNTPGYYPKSARIENPGVTSFVVENLPAGTIEFVATSFNSAGIESDYSNPMTKVVD